MLPSRASDHRSASAVQSPTWAKPTRSLVSSCSVSTFCRIRLPIRVSPDRLGAVDCGLRSWRVVGGCEDVCLLNGPSAQAMQRRCLVLLIELSKPAAQVLRAMR